MSIQKLYIAPNECIVYNQNKILKKIQKKTKNTKTGFKKGIFLSETTRLQ